MSDSVSNQTRAQIDALCKQIAVAHDLNPEIQGELAGHMEDKLLGYLNGQEPLTEDDAFILVREHFGDPAEIKAQLQNVHSVAANFSLVRRLCAVSAVHMALLNATGLAYVVIWISAAWIYYSNPPSRLEANLIPFLMFIVFAAATYAYWWILKNWQRRIRNGELLWFQRWNGLQIAVALFALASLQLVIPVLSNANDSIAIGPFGTSLVIQLPGALAAYGCLIVQACLWFWWSDTTPRHPRTLTITGLVWLSLMTFPWSALHIVKLSVYSYRPAHTTPDISGKFVLWHAHNGESSGLWSLEVAPIGHLYMDVIGYSFVFMVFTIALAKFIYLRTSRA